MKDALHLLIISDLHAHSGDPNKSDAPSHYSTNALYKSSSPLDSIPKIVKESNLAVDWVVCPGDIGDKADPMAQTSAWTQLDDIRSELGAELLIGTAGNHDIDSRRARPDFDPKSALQMLKPEFPTNVPCFKDGDGVNADRFWAKNFVVIPFAEFDCTLLVVNSCAFHGYASDVRKPPTEHLRGKLSPLTLAAIKSATANLSTRMNILLVHHHPLKLPYVDDQNSWMIGGDKLLDTLKDTAKQWFVVHGHQHVPNLMYADSDPFSAIVLSAGSVAAKTFRVKGGQARNQIHHVTFDLSKIEPNGSQIFGRITSWSWAFELGWVASPGPGAIPFKAGFGYRFDALSIRDSIVTAAKIAAPALLRWKDVTAANNKLEYVSPSDQASLVKLVKEQGVKVECDENGFPTNLEWPQ